MNSRFILISQSLGLSKDSFTLTDGTAVLGRSSKCDFVLGHDSISAAMRKSS